MEAEKRYYSTKDVQTILSVSRTTANQIMHEIERAGQLFRHGDILRVEIKVFDEWRRKHTVERLDSSRRTYSGG